MTWETIPVAILGMHRSGTSSLAGSLQQQGMYLGKVFEQNPHNQKGNRENAQIVSLNDSVLTTSGGSWDSPPTTLAWMAQQAAERDSIVQCLASGNNRLWGFKDPRTLLTLRFWASGIRDLRLVGTFRHPMLVTQSLVSRDSISREKALELWYAYNLKLLTCLEEREFPLVSFDVPAAEYQRSIERVAAKLGIAHVTGDDAEHRFFEESLRHHTLADGGEPLMEEVAWLYDKLNQRYQRQCG